MRSYRRRDKKPVDLTRLEGCLTAAVSCAGQLRRSLEHLPKVDAEGHSDCPFAKQLYAKKDELQQELRGLFEQLQEYLADVEWLIGACKNDMTVVSANENRMHSDRAREHFSEEEVRLATKYKHYLQLRDRIERTIQSVEETLDEASTKSYPSPKLEVNSEGRSPPIPLEVDPSAPQPFGADKELDDLFELDRRRQLQE